MNSDPTNFCSVTEPTRAKLPCITTTLVHHSIPISQFSSIIQIQKSRFPNLRSILQTTTLVSAAHKHTPHNSLFFSLFLWDKLPIHTFHTHSLSLHLSFPRNLLLCCGECSIEDGRIWIRIWSRWFSYGAYQKHWCSCWVRFSSFSFQMHFFFCSMCFTLLLLRFVFFLNVLLVFNLCFCYCCFFCRPVVSLVYPL